MGKKRNCPSRKYSHEEDEWLKSYYPYHPYKETLQEFQKKFNRVVSERGFLSHCYKHLGLINQKHYFSKEQEQWLIENYSKEPRVDKIYNDFCKRFGNNKSKHAIMTKCSDMKIKCGFYYNDDELAWIKENYDKATLDIVYANFCNKFRKVSFSGFVSVAKRQLKLGKAGRGRFKKGNINYKQKIKAQMGIPNEMILSDLGNGKYMPMERKIYKKLSREKGNLCNGILTETMYDLELYKREIKEIERELL